MLKDSNFLRMKYYLSYAWSKNVAVDQHIENVRQFGGIPQENIKIVTQEQLETDSFFHDHEDLLNAGCPIWKPFLIHQVLSSCQPGDLLLYTDISMTFIADLSPLFALCDNQEIVVFIGNFTNTNTIELWTNPEAHSLMNYVNSDNSPHFMIDSSVLLFKKTDKTLKFVEEWLQFCVNSEIINELPNPKAPKRWKSEIR